MEHWAGPLAPQTEAEKAVLERDWVGPAVAHEKVVALEAPATTVL